MFTGPTVMPLAACELHYMFQNTRIGYNMPNTDLKCIKINSKYVYYFGFDIV